MIIKKRYPLKRITTIGLGGHCKEFICPEDEVELMQIIAKDPLFIGNGSNICFITEFYDRSIVSLKKMKKHEKNMKKGGPDAPKMHPKSIQNLIWKLFTFGLDFL